MTATGNGIWDGDLLGREAEAKLLIDFIVRRAAEREAEGKRGAYVLNLNAGWGEGKSYFLERLRAQLEAEGHVAAYVNAWRDDATGEPMVAVLASIEAALKPYLGTRPKVKAMLSTVLASGSQIFVAGLKGAGKQLGKKFVGDAADDVAELLGNAGLADEAAADAELTPKDVGESAGEEVGEAVVSLVDVSLGKRLDAYRSRQRSVDTFKAQMGKLIVQLGSGTTVRRPMFVLVDELDRCRPTYAISMLEEVKHLFDINHVVFIVATDTAQLAHSVNAVYGQGFDSAAYLRRFFHRQYLFAVPELSAYVRMLFETHSIRMDLLASPPNDDHVSFFADAMKYYNLSLRDAEQCFDILRGFVTMWNYPVHIQLLYLLPIIIAHHRGQLGHTDWPHAFVNGGDATGWKIKLGRQRDASGYSDITAQVISMANSMHNMSRSPLHEVQHKENEGAAHAWVVQQFQTEFQTLHHGMIFHGKAHNSVLRHYAEAVRNVARFRELDAIATANH